ncbi:nuclear transport factor 2 family protein [Blastococcus sp. SYSU D00820]
MTSSTALPLPELPAAVTRYLAAHAAGDAATALGTFTADAVVQDDGRSYRGAAEVLDFLQHAGAQFSVTRQLIGARRDGADWVALVHLEGDFPGGVVDLAHRFTLAGERIARLVIAP